MTDPTNTTRTETPAFIQIGLNVPFYPACQGVVDAVQALFPRAAVKVHCLPECAEDDCYVEVDGTEAASDLRDAVVLAVAKAATQAGC
jgi:hypothetical protein